MTLEGNKKYSILDQLENKIRHNTQKKQTRRQAEIKRTQHPRLGERRTQHPMGDKLGNKPKTADSIPDQLEDKIGNKLRHKTGDMLGDKP